MRALGNETAFKLRKALYSRAPPLDVTEGVLKKWILKYRLPDDAISISGAEELEKKYGAAIRHLVPENRTGYKLQAALKKLSPPLYGGERTSKAWLSKDGTAKPVTQMRICTMIFVHRIFILRFKKYLLTGSDEHLET